MPSCYPLPFGVQLTPFAPTSFQLDAFEPFSLSPGKNKSLSLTFQANSSDLVVSTHLTVQTNIEAATTKVPVYVYNGRAQYFVGDEVRVPACPGHLPRFLAPPWQLSGRPASTGGLAIHPGNTNPWRVGIGASPLAKRPASCQNTSLSTSFACSLACTCLLLVLEPHNASAQTCSRPPLSPADPSHIDSHQPLPLAPCRASTTLISAPWL